MAKAKNQADGYARALNDEGDGWPPFLIITDVGYSIELWAEFTRSGRSYQQFPNAAHFRIELEDLRKEETRIAKDVKKFNGGLFNRRENRCSHPRAELGKSQRGSQGQGLLTPPGLSGSELWQDGRGDWNSDGVGGIGKCGAHRCAEASMAQNGDRASKGVTPPTGKRRNPSQR